MLNYLKHWFHQNGGRSPSLGRSARAFCQFERLETRAVLSANFGEAPAYSEIGEVAVSEYSYAPPAPHWESPVAEFAPPLAAQTGSEERASFHGFPSGADFYRPPEPQRVIIIYRFYAYNPPGQPLRAQFGGPANGSFAPAGLPPFSLTGNFPNSSPVEPPLRAMAQAGSTLNTATLGWLAETSETMAPSTLLGNSRDAAFEEYTTETYHRLTLDDRDIRPLCQRADGEPDLISDTESKETAELCDFAFRDDVSLSLDVLESELQAVDAVLASLPDFASPRASMPKEANYSNRCPNEAFDWWRAESYRPAALSAVAGDEVENVAVGGMVLLQTNNGGNDAAIDLPQIIIGTHDHAVVAPVGMDLPVGVSQEFEVGGDGGPSNGTTTPITDSSAAATASHAKGV